MRAYHFLKADYGVEDIRLRRLKVATFDELNDPFELLGFSLRDKTLRRGLPVVKERAGEKMGLLCFSRNWRNPVMWSHYGDRHTGLCLGFDVPDHEILEVKYSSRRVPVALEDFKSPSRDMNFVLTGLFTKYSHWRYEDEVRLLVHLDEAERDGDWRFAHFEDGLRLANVIVGAQSPVTRTEVSDALGDLAMQVDVFKARLAFGTFRVVRQKRDDLW